MSRNAIESRNYFNKLTWLDLPFVSAFKEEWTEGEKLAKTEERKKDLDKTLKFLVKEQIEELENANLTTFLSNDKHVLFTALKQTDRFKKILFLAEKESVNAKKKDMVFQFERRLYGKLLENMAYYALAAREYPIKLVLSPERTEDFYFKLFPQNRVLPKPLNAMGISGISVPDGLLIENYSDKPKITGLIEITGRNFKDHSFDVKYDGYMKDISTKDKFPNDCISKNAQIIFVTPYWDPVNSLPDISWKENVEFRLLPFTAGEYHDYVKEVSHQKNLKNSKIFSRKKTHD